MLKALKDLKHYLPRHSTLETLQQFYNLEFETVYTSYVARAQNSDTAILTNHCIYTTIIYLDLIQVHRQANNKRKVLSFTNVLFPDQLNRPLNRFQLPYITYIEYKMP